MARQVDRHNPVKASYYERKTAREQRGMTGYNKFKEWSKTNSPGIYQKLERDEQESAQWDAYERAHLDDPATLAMWDEAEALVQSVMDKRHGNDYALLGIEPGATKRDIKNAYRRQARRLHPDKGGDGEAFKRMHAAYRKLLTIVKE